MKYCMKYNSKSKYLDEIDEILLNYDKQQEFFLELLSKYRYTKRIILYLEEIPQDSNLLNQLKNFKKDGISSVTLLLPQVDNDYIQKIKDLELSFFINYQAETWDEFNGLLELGVSDIYVVEDLGFELDKLSLIAKENSIQLRAYPNVAQSKWKTSDALRKFFIRPNDIEYYSQYIDVVEFYSSIDKSDVLYEIYKSGKWYGELKEIIVGFNSDLDNRYILEDFPVARTKCGKKCGKFEKCNICYLISAVAENLKENNLQLVNDKKEEKELITKEEFKEDLVDLLQK